MRVVDRLGRREPSWRELELLVGRLSRKHRFRPGGKDVLRLAQLYRDACTDLMFAEAHDLPRDTVLYLHALVGRAHNTLYRARGFRFRDWGRELFQKAPRILRNDPALRLSAAVFFGSFLICALISAARDDFAPSVIGEGFVGQLEQMYERPVDEESDPGAGRSDATMAGFYIQHNTSIGLQCFAWGLLFGLGSLYQLLSNGIILGTVFGHMARTPHAGNFFTFVTAHSSFELTAIVVSGAAGLRLGWGLIETQGETRLNSLRREAIAALPALGTAVVLFVLAAFVEGFVSASRLPYAAKLAFALLGAATILGYLILCGRGEPAIGSAGSVAVER